MDEKIEEGDMKDMKLKHIIIAFLLLLLTACGSKEEGSNEKESFAQLTVALWSQPITESVNLLVDDEKGFFKEKGIDLKVIPGAGGGDAIKNILSGQADIAFTDPGSLYFALDKGEKLKVIYNIYPQNVFNIVALKESGIEKPEDLKGKTIGVYSLTSGTRQNLLILLHQVGLTEDDVKIVETGISNFAPLIQGQVDATAATDTGLYLAKQKGLGDVNIIEVKDYLNVPSDVFVVTEKTFEEKKEELKRFVAAYRESAQWMLENPEEAAKLAKEFAIDGKDENINLEIIKLRNASSVSEDTEIKGLGAIDAEVLQKGADTYQQLGLVNNQLDMSQVVTEEFLEVEQ